MSTRTVFDCDKCRTPGALWRVWPLWTPQDSAQWLTGEQQKGVDLCRACIQEMAAK